MDSSNGSSNYKLEAIKAAIADGTLTKEEINKRVSHAIYMENKKQPGERDTDFVMACETILYEMYTGKPYVSRKEESKQALKNRLNQEHKRSVAFPKIMARGLALAGILLVLVIGVDTLVRREWLVGSSTDDEQQYVISGREIRTGLVEEGQADDSSAQSHKITTTDLDEAVEVLGFTPVMPQWVPDGWDVLTYYAAQAESGGRFIITYACDGQEYNLIYQVIYYRDAERASASFEQNKSGEEYTLTDGKIVYITDNYDDLTCVWNEGLALYSLIGPGDKSSFTRIIESIKER